jgi:hypothetical protein
VPIGNEQRSVDPAFSVSTDSAGIGTAIAKAEHLFLSGLALVKTAITCRSVDDAPTRAAPAGHAV